MLKGTYTALVTPFKKDGSFDRELFKDLIERQVQGKVEGIVVCGTTGESATLTHAEHNEIIRTAVEIAAGRITVIAGTGSNCTREAIDLTTQAFKDGVKFSLQVCPYYNKPSQEGLYQHFKLIAEATPQMKHIVYNVPGRSGRNIEPETILRLAEIPNIVAVKEAGGNVEQLMAICAKKPADFIVLSGDDALTVPFMAVGAEGLISVASNLFPAEVSEMVRLANAGRFAEARAIHYRYLDFFHACFIECNPAAIKAMLALEGVCNETVRPPLATIQPDNKAKMKKILEKLR